MRVPLRARRTVRQVRVGRLVVRVIAVLLGVARARVVTPRPMPRSPARGPPRPLRQLLHHRTRDPGVHCPGALPVSMVREVQERVEDEAQGPRHLQAHQQGIAEGLGVVAEVSGGRQRPHLSQRAVKGEDALRQETYDRGGAGGAGRGRKCDGWSSLNLRRKKMVESLRAGHP